MSWFGGIARIVGGSICVVLCITIGVVGSAILIGEVVLIVSPIPMAAVINHVVGVSAVIMSASLGAAGVGLIVSGIGDLQETHAAQSEDPNAHKSEDNAMRDDGTNDTEDATDDHGTMTRNEGHHPCDAAEGLFIVA